MKSPIKFLCPRWGFEDVPWPTFLKQVKESGYSGIEWFPFAEKCNVEEVLDLLKAYTLDYAIVMAVITPYSDYEIYVEELRKSLDQLMKIRTESQNPLFFSAQTGREFFDELQIQSCIDICTEIENVYQTPIYQETHRNKWSYAVHRVEPILKKNPYLKLTLDVSHWFCVSESYLEDQQLAVERAIAHARHIHARVGSTQSSQVWNPANAEYQEALNAHLKVWDKWIDGMRDKKYPITITPEFGPVPYMIKGNRTSDLRTEQWQINLWMKNLLQERYR
ncbi:sugar phosphate isomerase/epimerase family protein [Pedobacter sp. MW01-1-1]|uniref:sugar phosphate isomerase/epimerase family protein n=1 Tax=Pedobacter sp. MW01-1-1 TaxID=3383027 RepID=UPI003FEE372E